ncbi:MAG: SPOR domain-containing protein [Gammaproteobacteria bacterium]|nr:SPOR domain-containing protein [Gammaproteobacteria bacterium]MCW9004856.1 SPOR domain-containing protein [Gammaproteobacteria bacterium]MCW9057049.1 SPOR domain-containing protein [Gammaproteobacteria bacterium]
MPDKKSLPGYIWLLAGLAIGLFASFLLFLEKQPEEKLSFKDAVIQELEKVSAAKPDNKNSTENTTKKTSSEPRFDFYTILPELEVFIPESEITRKTNNKKTVEPSNDTTSSGKQYLLQAGSFNDPADANRLKATLALMGVESTIQSVNIKNDTWHRVRIGPFNNSTRLHDTLSTLKQNNIHAMTMELKN